MHLIPTSSRIEEKLKGVQAGQKVKFKGYLVRVDMDSGWHWVSSLTRKDAGGGACEIVLVDDFLVM